MAKQTAQTQDKEKLLGLAVAQIEKQFGAGSIMRLGGKDSRPPIPTISTGALTLDIALGIGGLPRGKIVEIYGPESSGKTTLSLQTIANAQKYGGTAAFIDAEHALDPIYAEKIGVKTEDLLISQPDCGEDALSIAEILIRSNSVDIVVIDSVAALTPKAEIEGNMGDAHMALQARLMSQALRKLTSVINKSKTCCVFINQLREKVGFVLGSPEVTPGGKALKFYSSIRLDVRKGPLLKNNSDETYGNMVKVKVVKNKMAPPFTVAELEILYNEGISREGSIISAAVQHNIISKKGSWFSFGEQRLGQGREATRQFLKENPDICDQIVKIVKNPPVPDEKADDKKTAKDEQPATAEKQA